MKSTTFRRAPALWKVYGEIRAESAKGWYKASRRTVVVVAEDFVQAARVGADALVEAWANTPHVGRVLSISPITLGEDWTLLWPEEGDPSAT